MHTTAALDLFAGSQQQVLEVVGPIPDERWAEQPAGIRNHVAWTLGHLSVGIDMAMQLLGRGVVCPDASWNERMGNSSMPVADRGAYPSRDELLATYARGHEALTAAVRATPDATFEAELPAEEYKAFFPTIGHAIAYFLLSHDQNHLGQLLVWRRAAGLAPA